MTITDEMLREAAAQAQAAILAALPEPEDCAHEFSPAFERRMRALIRRHRHPGLRRFSRRAAAVLLAALLGAGTWLTVDVRARETFFQWVREIYEDQIVYRFFGEQREEFPAYRPSWLPEGYVETDFFDGHAVKMISYENAKGDLLTFSYSPMQEGTSESIVSEGRLPEDVSINGLQGDFYASQGPEDISNLIWMDEESKMVFSLDGLLDKTDMVHIAESVFLVESTK